MKFYCANNFFRLCIYICFSYMGLYYFNNNTYISLGLIVENYKTKI